MGALAWPAGSYPHLSPCLGGGLAIHSSPHPVKSPTESDHTASLKVLSCWWLLGRRGSILHRAHKLHTPPTSSSAVPHAPLPRLQPRGPPLSSWKRPQSSPQTPAHLSGLRGGSWGSTPPPWLSVRGLHSSDGGHPSAGSFSESRCPGDMQAPREQPCLSHRVFPVTCTLPGLQLLRQQGLKEGGREEKKRTGYSSACICLHLSMLPFSLKKKGHYFFSSVTRLVFST